MEYRVLGRTGIKVSSYCLGTGNFGAWGNTNVEECIQIVDESLAKGINFIDTADVYSAGGSEEILGKALKGRREEVVLTSKVGLPMGKGLNQSGNSRFWIRREVENSLRRLQTDYIDLYQLHRPDPSTDIEETLSVLTELVQEGKIRYFGSSTFQAWQIVEAHMVSETRNLGRLSSEQPPYSILNRSIELDVLEATRKYGMGVLVWSPLSGGLLSGKYSKGQATPEDSRAHRFQGNYLGSIVDPAREENRVKFEIISLLQEVAKEAGLSLPHMAMAFTQAHPSVTSTIIGPRTIAHLQDTLNNVDARLSSDILDAIDKIVAPGKTLDDMERGWAPDWLAASQRRRA
ncbi:Predicted oxidoreductase [Paenibacillus sp. yr247]|uniref:aldo/keto reductase n=1 Tax=Paenibacillus sp. yr247 TaxID=1761880 RepID=UPI00088E3E65|nr:aldo/keto reductase [Paenibacillus sp. yr247]SDN43328.1 Predicted oxidoreductase [Paenibacillus sp. yr247]